VAYSTPLPGWQSSALLIDWVDGEGCLEPSLLRSLASRPVSSVIMADDAVNLSDQGLAEMLHCAAHLRALGLDGCDCLTDEGVLPLASRSSLQAISLAGCDSLSALAIASIVKGLAPHLAALDLSYLDVADETLALLFPTPPSPPAAAVATAAAAATAAADADADADADAPTTCPATTLADSFTGLTQLLLPELLSLSLNCCATLCDETVSRLPHLAPNLCAITLSKCLDLTDAAVAGLLARLPSLTSVDVSYMGISEEGTVSAMCALPCLTSINMEGCPLCTEYGVSRLTGSLPSLQFMNISGCDVDESLGDTTARQDDAAGEADVVFTPRSTPQFLLSSTAGRSVADAAVVAAPLSSRI